MKRTSLGRRTLLRGMGGIAIALPWLEAMEAKGQTAPPKRFIGCVNFDGTRYADWLPSGSETAFTLGPILQPLAPYRSKLLILDGVDNEVSYHGPAPGGHDAGTAGLLSNAYTQAGSVYCGGGGCTGWGNGITVDQHLGKTLFKGTAIPSLTLGVQPSNVTVLSHISYAGPAQPVPPLSDPVQVFNKLFAGFSGTGTGTTTTTDPALERLRLQRKSVLDAVLESMGRLSSKLGAADQARLDQHATAIREVEAQVTQPPPTLTVTTTCGKPASPNAPNPTVSANFPTTSRQMIDLLSLGLACDLTRSVTLQWGRSTGGLTFPWLGISESQHNLSHAGDSDSVAQGKITRINQYFASEFAYLLQKLSAVQEGGQTLLDNSVCFWGNGLSKGNVHARRSVPFVLAGSAGGYFRTGRFLRMGGRPHGELLVSILNAMGDPTRTFGEAQWGQGPLANLT
jgi:hypothetical protein